MDVLNRLLQGKEVNAIVSDPPYGMKLDARYTFSKGSEAMSIKASKGYSNVIGDDKNFDASFLFSAFPSAKEIFLFGADYYVDSLPNYGKSGSWMVWDKKNEALRNVLGLADFELIWTMKKHKRRVYAVLWNGALGTESEDTKRRVHPTQKPLKLLIPIIDEYIKPEMLVIDPFLGSGATLIACEQLDRTCYGCELDPKYCDVILTRWENHTGQTAQLIERVEEAAHG
jgi:DNA modification methylase